MRMYLIRHSITYGNTLGRYIGRTDEPLCKEGQKLLENRKYPPVQKVYVSPLKRCVMTANIIYPEQRIQMVNDLAECDFGIFENKNYKELDGDFRYQSWVDSGGTLPFPGGESQETFRKRCRRGFETAVEDAIDSGIKTTALIIHGGTIMAILDHFAVPHRDFYDWHVKNAGGFEIELNEACWKKGIREVTVCRELESAADGEKT